MMICKKTPLLSCIFLSLFLSGCGVNNISYEKPKLTPPKNFLEDTIRDNTAKTSAKEWWLGYEDTYLESILSKVVTNNHEIKAAKAIVKQYESALLKVTSEEKLQVDGSLDLQRDDKQYLDTKESTKSSSLSGGIDLSYSFDIFGHKRVQKLSARAALKQAHENLNFIVKKKRFEAVEKYISLKGLQEKTSVLEKMKILREKTLALTKEKFQLGLASKLDTQRAEALLKSLNIDVLQTQKEIKNYQHELANLCGYYFYEKSQFDFGNSKKLPIYKNPLPSFLPLDVIQQRADVKKAELLLEKAVYDIGVAKSQLYPIFTLGGELKITAEGIIGGSVTELILSSINALIQQTLYDGGVIKADIAQKEALASEALENYKQSLKTAVLEVQMILEQLQSSRQKQASLKELSVLKEKTFKLSETLFNEGLSNFLDVIEAQKDFTQNKLDLVDEQREYARLLSEYFYKVGK